MDVLFQQSLDFRQLQRREFLGQLEDFAHPDAREEVAFGVVAGAGLEVAHVLALLCVRAQRVEPLEESGGGKIRGRGQHRAVRGHFDGRSSHVGQ